MSSIVFCGDLVLPYRTQVDYKNIENLFCDKIAVANLEGCILPNEFEINRFKWNDKYSLYSSSEVLNICKRLNIKYVSLCNNHILDYKYPIEYTKKILSDNGIASWGLNNYDIIRLSFNNKPLYIITFATYANEHSLGLFNPDAVVDKIREIKSTEECKIVVFPHWGVEKFIYPEPADRHHAHRMIDAGADLIVGHHPHIVQPIEIYKEKYIVYSIGNFILPQTYYGSKKLIYEDSYIQNELVVEWDGNNVMIHTLFFDKYKNAISLNKDFDLNSLYTLFEREMDDWQYTKLFLRHSSLINKIFRTRYFDTKQGEVLSFIMRRVFRTLRRGIMAIGLHKPYKE